VGFEDLFIIIFYNFTFLRAVLTIFIVVVILVELKETESILKKLNYSHFHFILCSYSNLSNLSPTILRTFFYQKTLKIVIFIAIIHENKMNDFF